MAARGFEASTVHEEVVPGRRFEHRDRAYGEQGEGDDLHVSTWRRYW